MKINANIPTQTISTKNKAKSETEEQQIMDSVAINTSSVEYSSMGKILAKSTYESGCHSSYAEDQRKIQKEGFEAILKNPATTEDEKTLANLGITFGSHYMQDISAARARNKVLKAIMNGVSGPMGTVIADLTFEAGKSVDYAEEQRMVQKNGLEIIAGHSKTTEDEKTLANLGITFGSHYMQDISAARARNKVLNTIIGGISGPIGSVIAKVTYDSGVSVEYASEQRMLQRDGFEAIINNPKTTDEQKALARHGINVGDDYMTDSSAAKARNQILQELY